LLSSNAAPRVRIGGSLQRLDQQPHSVEELLEYVEPAMGQTDDEAFESEGSCDVALTSAHGARYRANLFKQERGLALALRPIGREVPTLDALGLPQDFQQLTRHRSGLVLMAGTAGSGKSTTLVALIEHLNRTVDKHIITLEDPIEYLYRPQRCLIHQRELGRHVSGFSSGLRAALRESPDVILVGEMRDRETISAALTAAETGHLVLSTLHSANAAMAIERIIDIFPDSQQTQVRYQLANVLRAVVTQILLPSTEPPLRVAAYERLEVTSAVSTKIRENRGHQIETELQRGRAEGMVPLELSLARLVQRKRISFELAHQTARDPLLLEQLVRQP
jgi:twitching motility protein PilT